MIKVTIWNEYIQEQMDTREFMFQDNWNKEYIQRMKEQAKEIRVVHNGASIHDTLKSLVEESENIQVCHVATLEMPECGLTKEVLDDTDVLVWWSHVAQEQVPYEVAIRVRDYVQRGMGIIFLHSAHMSRPMQLLLGTSCTLRWREGDKELIWCCTPAHPIAKGVQNGIYLEQEEMYGEYFDIPEPDELVFISGFGGGEVFRSGCVWNRGYGKVFYFQPGHETNRSYFHPEVRKIIQNAVKYLAQDEKRRENIECLAV